MVPYLMEAETLPTVKVILKKKNKGPPWLVWLGWLECRPIHPKAVGLLPVGANVGGN